MASAFTLTYRKSALKRLRKIQPAKAADIEQALMRIAADPTAKYNNVTPLTGVEGGFRARIGNWRASYTLDKKACVMDVFEIAPRGGAYR